MKTIAAGAQSSARLELSRLLDNRAATRIRCSRYAAHPSPLAAVWTTAHWRKSRTCRNGTTRRAWAARSGCIASLPTSLYPRSRRSGDVLRFALPEIEHDHHTHEGDGIQDERGAGTH